VARDAHRDPGSAAPAGRRARQDPRRGGAGRLGRGAAIPRTGGRSPGRRGPGGIGIAARTARIGRPRRNGIPIYRCRPRFLIRARFTSATAGPTLRRRPVAWSPPLTAKTSFVFEASRIGQERVDAIEGDAAFPRPRRTADRLHPGRTPHPGPKCRGHRSPPLARGRPASRPPSAGTTGPSRSEILPPCGTPPDTRLRAAERGGPSTADVPAPGHPPGRELPVPPREPQRHEAGRREGRGGRTPTPDAHPASTQRHHHRDRARGDARPQGGTRRFPAQRRGERSLPVNGGRTTLSTQLSASPENGINRPEKGSRITL
jgi:hypothetical protein